MSQDNKGVTKTLGETITSTHCDKCGGLIGRRDFNINSDGTRTHKRCDPDSEAGIHVEVSEEAERPICEECGYPIEGVVSTTTSGGPICEGCADENPELVGYEGPDDLTNVPIGGQN